MALQVALPDDPNVPEVAAHVQMRSAELKAKRLEAGPLVRHENTRMIREAATAVFPRHWRLRQAWSGSPVQLPHTVSHGRSSGRRALGKSVSPMALALQNFRLLHPWGGWPTGTSRRSTWLAQVGLP
jgi:hypothetical protein